MTTVEKFRVDENICDYDEAYDNIPDNKSDNMDFHLSTIKFIKKYDFPPQEEPYLQIYYFKENLTFITPSFKYIHHVYRRLSYYYNVVIDMDKNINTLSDEEFIKVFNKSLREVEYLCKIMGIPFLYNINVAESYKFSCFTYENSDGVFYNMTQTQYNMLMESKTLKLPSANIRFVNKCPNSNRMWCKDFKARIKYEGNDFDKLYF